LGGALLEMAVARYGPRRQTSTNDSAEEIFFFGTVAQISMFACWWDAKHEWKNIVFRVYGIKK
jgi:hypothetical protein